MAKHNYPYSVVRAVKQWYLHNADGISEKEIQNLSRIVVLEAYLEWEGIIGYTHDIIEIMTK